MIDKNILINFYTEQFRLDVARSRNKNVRVKNPEERIGRLRHQMRSANPGRLSITTLEDYHHQVRNLYTATAARHSDKLKKSIEKELFPLLVRLDMGTVMPQQQEGINGEFLAWLEKEQPTAVCSKPLILLYPAYKEEIITEQITGMVPVRPEMEFPEALEMKRKFILHIGPTNSGKTFNALERLKTARQGIYLGPLRLLALEVFERMRDDKVPATMLTGQEHIADDNSRVTAATVEMADLDVVYDIAVIDEAQMMADRDRGHSWTRALLGLLSPEIHVCASPAAEKALIHLIELCHDEYEIHHYERMTPLEFEKEPFDFPEDTQPGDALIVFSKKAVLDVAGRLEEAGVNCSVIYGSLPPEIRRKQMHLFASGETKVVVSTDAIGMGLNLPVRRIVFLQDSKYDGQEDRRLSTSEIRQIAGRAGRYGIYETGYITGRDKVMLSYLKRTYQKPEGEVEKVSLGFPQILLSIDEPLDEILKVWHNVEPIEPFEKENVDEMLFLYEKAYAVREKIQDFDNKKLLYRMISCPIDIKDRDVVALWLSYCTSYRADTGLEKPRLSSRDKRTGLARYETYYKQLDTYYQMSYRLGKILDEEWVLRERAKTEERIMRYLLKDKGEYIRRCRYCGRMLPINSPFGTCEKCWRNLNFY